jgi:hypothetical protein
MIRLKPFFAVLLFPLLGCRGGNPAAAAGRPSAAGVPQAAVWVAGSIIRCGTSKPISLTQYAKATKGSASAASVGYLSITANAKGVAVFVPSDAEGYLTVACKSRAGQVLGRQCFALHIVADPTSEGSSLIAFANVPSGATTIAAALTIGGKTARLGVPLP